jgi:hypothetical protein
MVMLLLTLIPLVLLLGGFTMAMHGREQRLVNDVDRERCFWAAEAGIDDAIHKAGAGLLMTAPDYTLSLGEGLSTRVHAVNIGKDGIDNDHDGRIDEPDEDLLEVHSTGGYRTCAREVVVWLGRVSFLPALNAAATLASKNTDIRLTGTPQINGNNTNLSGALGNAALSKYGVSIMTPGTTANLSSLLTGAERTQVLGIGGTPSLGTTPAFDTNAVVAAARNAANLVLTNSNYASYKFGSGASGQGYVTYRNGDLKITGNSNGAGVLVVTGDLSLAGNFRFDGVIIVLGSINAGAGTADVYGATVLGPSSTELRVTGTFRLHYSDQAIQLANQLAGRYSTFNGWQEVHH